MDSIRVLIVDDHPIVREGLRTLISSAAGMELVGEALDGFEAVKQTRTLQPDVILMDLIMPRKNGLEAIAEIKEEFPDARILVLTSFSEDDKVFLAIKAGALGYLLKDSPPQELVEAIRAVYRGAASLNPNVALKLVRELNQPSSLPPTEKPLTPRELVVLQLLAKGLSNQEIASKLTVSVWTIRTHVRNILSKLHMANRTQAALYAQQEGIGKP